MKPLRWFWLVGAMVALVGCGWGPQAPSSPGPGEVATAVAATLQALGHPTSAAPTAPAPSPTSQPTPPPTAQPTAPPAPPAAPWPSGVWVGDEASHTADFYRLPTTDIGGTANLPPNASVDADLLRPVGPADQVAFVYTDFQPQVLTFVPPSGPAQPYAALPPGAGGAPSALIALLSHPPSAHFAYAYMVYGANYQQRSYLALGALGQSPRQVLDVDASEGYGLLPLGYEMDAQGAVQALWATTRLFGIGNVMVAPSRGLWRVDLGSGQATPILPPSANGVDHHILGVAPNGAAFAYWRQDDPGHVQVGFPGQGQPVALSTVAAVTDASTIGYAAFSPDARYVAWAEYTGSFDAGYQGHVALYDLTTAQPLSVTNPLPGSYAVAPVAWVSAHTLLLSGWDGNDPVVVLWDFQGQAAPTVWLGHFLGVQH